MGNILCDYAFTLDSTVNDFIYLLVSRIELRAYQLALVVKNLPGNAGDIRDVGSIPGLGRSSGGGHGNPLQYSCLENPMDREAWLAGYSP